MSVPSKQATEGASERKETLERKVSKEKSKLEGKEALERKLPKEQTKIEVEKLVEQLKFTNKNSVIALFCCAARLNMPEVLQAIWDKAKTMSLQDESGKIVPLSSFLDSCDIYKATALDYAISAGNANSVRLLHSLMGKLNLNATAFNHKTPLQNAIQEGHLDIVKYLVTLAEVTLDSAALDAALEAEKLNVAWFIICKIKYNKKQLCDLMSLAAKQNQVSVLKSVITQIIRKSSSVIAWDKEITTNGQTILGTAVAQNHSEAVKLLIEQGKADVNHPDRSGMSPLHHAAAQGNIEIARYLYEQKAILDNNSYQGQTPLMIAVESDDIEMTKLFLSLKADINQKVKGKAELETPLLIALKNNSFGLAYYLFKKGAIASKTELITLFCLAIKNHHTIAIEEFKKLIEDFNRLALFSGHTPLMCAAAVGNTELMRYLLQEKANPNYPVEFQLSDLSLVKSTGTVLDMAKFFNPNLADATRLNAMIVKSSGALHECARHGQEQAAEILIQAGAVVEATNLLGVTPLEAAAASNQVGMVKLLLHHGADMERKSLSGYTAVFFGALYKHTEVLKIFLARKPHANVQGALSNALFNKAIDVVALFLPRMTKLTVQEQADVLCLAAQSNRPTLIRALLGKAGIEPNIINILSTDGWSALSLATQCGYRNIVHLLIKNKADVNQLNKDGSTPLHQAVSGGAFDIACDLLAAGSKLDSELPNGETPLCIAAKNSLHNLMVLLLNRGAKINHQAKNSGTPLFLAVENGHVDIVWTLLKRKADSTIPGYPKTYRSLTDPILVSLFNHNTPIAEMLVQTGAKQNVATNSLVFGLSLLNQLNPRYQAIPNQLYFIWVGGPMPKLRYLVTVMQLAALAKKSNFVINLVVDHPYDFHRAAVQFDVNIPNLKLLSVFDVIKKMQMDDFYQANIERLKQFLSCLIREAVGFKNLASFADFIRIEILRQRAVIILILIPNL